MDVSNFISPKELIKIKREIVEQALALANPIIAIEYQTGIMLMAENPSSSLNKVSEIYDNIVFAGTGVYNDYERLRRAGVQYADVKGFSYSRKDVKAKAIAGEYSTILGDIFARQQLPWEVEILVAELGPTNDSNRMYVIPFSGGLVEENTFCAIGDIYRDKEGEIQRNVLHGKLLAKELTGAETLESTVSTAYEVLNSVKPGEGVIDPTWLEVVLIDRNVERQRKMRRLSVAEIDSLVS